MKRLLYILGLSGLFACGNKNTTAMAQMTPENLQNRKSIHQFKVENLNGNEFDFVSLKGKKIIVVNTASKCGLTPQYEALEKLYKKYGESKNLVIVGFPANDFLWQEPGTNEEIATFCQRNYGVTFPMMAKISVKGKDQHPIYKFLTQKALNGFMDSEVSWNFQKYLINEQGQIDKVISPKTAPDDAEVIQWIEK